MTLKDLKPTESAVIETVGGEGALRQHFLDMGVIPGAEVTLIKYAPMGDPIELRIHGYELTLRLADAEKINICKIDRNTSCGIHSEGTRPLCEFGNDEREDKDTEKMSSRNHNGSKKKISHPGLGEEGKYHVKENENPLPDGKVISFALVGNQNCGKTTLFNQLTGSNQHVGNFPGVTVDKKTGPIRGHADTVITDLPGIYSLSPYTAEEIVSREFIFNEKPDGILNIVDATSIERSLYLTLQLLTLDIPMVLAVNFMDELTGNGGSIDINAMESLLGIPVVPISAAKNQGVDELVKHAYHVAKFQEKPGRNDFCTKTRRGGAVHRCIHGVKHLVEDHAHDNKIPARFAATKLIEGDTRIADALKLSQNEIETVEHIVLTMEEESGLDRAAAIADMRFSFINSLTKEAVTKPHESKEHLRSAKIDKILTGKYTAVPVFILIMGLIFYLTFNVIGSFLQGLMEEGIDLLIGAADTWLAASGVSPWLHSFIIEGILGGVGSILSFIPIIVTLFFFLSILEDTGYMARVAFVTDKLLRKIGLSGRSIVPMLIGFGCTVPAVMATRTLPSARDRRMTLIMTPFMSCTAKLPVYGLLTAVFFPEHAGLIMIGLYILGIVLSILVALISKNVLFKGEAVPFVMELPNYRMPGARNVLMLLWEKAKDFLEKAFTIILLASIVVWFLQSLSWSFEMVESAQDSILAGISGWLAPLFAPLGLNDWRIVTAIATGIVAKESVVASLEITYGSTAALLSSISIPAAAALLVFCLIYTPCIAAISAIRREAGTKWTIGIVLFQCVFAWVVAFIVHTLLVLIL